MSVVSTPRNAGWLRNPGWDLGLIGFCWLPFVAYFVLGLGLGVDESMTRVEARSALKHATLVALAITYVHRHLTFLLVYGDRQTFETRARAFTWAPIFVFGVCAAVVHFQGDTKLSVPGLSFRISPWFLILMVTGAWNIWHTLMQRHGLARIYAKKAHPSLADPQHARRDLALLWSMGLLTAALTLRVQGSSFSSLRNARRMYKTLGPLVEGWPGALLVSACASVFAWALWRWLRVELAAYRAGAPKAPRVSFWLSNLALCSTFVFFGPIVGYLAFGTAHALEYVAFFHHFGAAKFQRQPDNKSLAARLLRRPRWTAVPLIISLLLLFWLLREHRRTEVYVAYYTATSLLHFLFDGWIWKVRRPEVAQPLGVAPQT